MGATTTYENGSDAAEGQMQATAAAVERIEDAGIQSAVSRLVDGARVGLRDGNDEVTGWCVKTIASVALVLNEAISAEVTAGILDGLWEDAAVEAAVVRQSMGFWKFKGYTCAGSRRCRKSPTQTCYVFSSPGCGNTSGFSFDWDTAI